MYKIFILLICFARFASAQDSLQIQKSGLPVYEENDSVRIIRLQNEKHIGVLASFNQGRYSFGEIGMSFLRHTLVGHHSFSSAYFFSSEFRLGDKLIVGPKIGVWSAGGMGGTAFGLNMMYYTDFDDGAFVLRPEIGFGMFNFKLVYGYNWNLTNKDFREINTHFAGITYSFPIRIAKIDKEIRIYSTK
ncbi:hypothetical protein [Moheibacter sediminis]|uniref:DUF3575 domain-containing protein n=1 Tax=Moheibacter sediminis TaxID=1434700 RepID=A0A1W1ZYF7_9FLAO|nr:hypothetical protein [Moheibacter sediminis]SMC53088.1 hypothetical protein SAMN06296427_103309 [Moheibacter sediminis]